MIRVNRESFLQKLEAVTPGLTKKDVIEQSSCFVFQDNTVFTFNDEITCRNKVDVDITGAVQAEPLLALLRKLVEEEVELETTDTKLIVKGKKRSAGIHMEQEILLPVMDFTLPEKWRKLHPDFSEAIDIVHHTAGKDESEFITTCVHVHPEYVEAFDNYQATRYKLETGIKTPLLIRASSIKHICSLGMTKFGETPSWIHFKNSEGLIVSCRRQQDDYKDLGPILAVRGQRTPFPKGLGEACDKAQIFSSENVESNQVMVELRPGKMRIIGEGLLGWYKEVKSIEYDGEPCRFRIDPKCLIKITQEHNECEIADDKLKVNGGKFTYVTVLNRTEGEEQDE